MRSLIVGISILVTVISGSALAAPPSHCKPGEYSIVAAWMGKFAKVNGEQVYARNGKVLSLCADGKVEPFSSVTYRYGTADQIEFEVVASSATKFNIANRQTGPRMGEDLVFFRKGSYTYYVSMGTGQELGVSLHVFQGNKKIGSFSSGLGEGEDYQIGPAAIDAFSGIPRSPIFVRANPQHDF